MKKLILPLHKFTKTIYNNENNPKNLPKKPAYMR